MKTTLNKIASILAFIIGAMAVFAGGQALLAAILTFSLHALVMLTLLTVYQGVVAPDSLRAMTIRLVVWAIILGLMLFQLRKNKAAVGAPGS